MTRRDRKILTLLLAARADLEDAITPRRTFKTVRQRVLARLAAVETILRDETTP